MNENYNRVVGTLLSKKREEQEKARKQLQEIKKEERRTYLRYVMRLGTAEIRTNKPDMWLEQGAVIIREVQPNGEEKRRRGRPRRQ